MDINSISQRIKELCTARGWSYYRLAKEAGFQQSILKPILKEKNMPSIYTLSKICKAFGISLSTFFKSSLFDGDYVPEDEIIEIWDKLSPQDKERVLIYTHGLLHTIPKEITNDIQRTKKDRTGTYKKK